MACRSTAQAGAGISPSSAQPSALNESGAAPLESIQKLIDKGNTAEALKQLAPLVARTPVPEGAFSLQGQAFYAANQFANADIAFEQAVLQNPKDLESLQMRGLTLFRLGRPADAIPLLTRSQQWNSQTRVDPSYLLALCYLDTRHYDDARHAFAMQYGFAPDGASAYLLAARMFLRRQFVPVARTYAQKALELDPQLPLAHELLGEVALSENHFEEAINEFTTEQKRNPLNPDLYDRIGDALVRSGRYQDASQWLQRAVLLEPASTGPYILLGKVLLKQNAPANAARYLEHAEAMDPSNYMTHALLSQAYRATGRAEEATRQSDLSQQLQSAKDPKPGAMQ